MIAPVVSSLLRKEIDNEAEEPFNRQKINEVHHDKKHVEAKQSANGGVVDRKASCLRSSDDKSVIYSHDHASVNASNVGMGLGRLSHIDLAKAYHSG